MSQEDVQVAREGFEALASDGYEALLERIHPDFEMSTPPGLATEPQTYNGPDGVRRWFESFYEVMDEVRVDAEHYEDVGEGLVLMQLKLAARGQHSGIEATQSVVTLAHIEDGLLRRLEFIGTTMEQARANLAARRG